MFGGEAVAARDGVSDDAAGEGAAAIGEGRDGIVVIVQPGIAGEGAVLVVEDVVDTSVELIL